jgi:hypothetical protein
MYCCNFNLLCVVLGSAVAAAAAAAAAARYRFY